MIRLSLSFPYYKFILLFTMLGCCTSIYAQKPIIEWSISNGANRQNKIIATNDGGAIWAKNSTGTTNTSTLIQKLDANQQVIWDTIYGGSDGTDIINNITKVQGGYVLSGTSTSTDGTLQGVSTGTSWFFKINEDGHMLWQKRYNGAPPFNSVQETPDGGFIVSGTANSNTSYVRGWHEGTYTEYATVLPSGDAWAAKLNASGDTLWTTPCMGGTNDERAYDIKADIINGGYILAGSAYSTDGDILWGNPRVTDGKYWVIKLDDDGNMLWQKRYGGSSTFEYATSVQVTSSGKYIVSGHSQSSDGDISTPKGGGNPDLWVIWLENNGELIQDKSYGGLGRETAWKASSISTADGGFLLLGHTNQSGGDIDDYESTGSECPWLVKINNTGDILWTKYLFLYNRVSEGINSASETPDGGILIGSTGYWITKISTCPAHIKLTAEICMGKNYDFNGTILTEPGIYYDTTSQNGACPNYIELTLTVRPKFKPVITQSGNILTTDVYKSYSWILNDTPVSWANTQTLKTDASGTYKLFVTDNLDCISDTSDVFSFLYEGCEAPSIKWAKTYGGPGSDRINSITSITDGFLIAGLTNSSGGEVKGLHGTANDFWIIKINNEGDTLWTKTLGGNGADIGYAIRATSDGGFVVVGESAYNANAGDVSATRPIPGGGGADIWVIKFNSTGTIDWQYLYGGGTADNAYSIEPTSDGYIICGSVAHAATPNGTHTGSTPYGGNDGWILKLNTNGSLAWQKRYGGAGNDYLYSIKQTAEGGYITTGTSRYSATGNGSIGSTARPITGGGNDDIWIVKMNSTGDIEWQKLYGGSGADIAYSIKQTADGGYLIAGYAGSTSTDGTLSGLTKPGNFDYWIMKLNNTGEIVWQKLYGGSNSDQATSYDILEDTEGYVFAGQSTSVNGDATGNKGGSDYWVIKTDLTGNMLWQKTAGGSGNDQVNSLTQTEDGDYMLAGYVSAGGITDSKGGVDFYVVKLSACQTCTTPVYDTICAGDVYNFNGTPVAEAGIYADTTTSGSCHQIQAVKLFVNPLHVTPQTASICAGETYDFFGTPLSLGGEYKDTLASALGCDSIIVLTLSVNPLPVASVTASENQLSTGTFSSYKWLLNGVATGETSQTITAIESGNYQVVVTNLSNCTDTSAAYTHTVITGLTNADRNFVTLYPNPVTTEITLSFRHSDTHEISLFNMQGTEVLSQHISTDSATLNVEDLAQGVYFLKIWNNGTLKDIRKIVKK